MKNKHLFLTSFVVLFVLTSSVAFADTLTIRPDGQGAYTQFVNVGCGSGSSEWQCVDEVNVSTSDYLYKRNNNRRESFTFSNTGLTDEEINSVALYYYAYRYNSKNYKMQPLIRASSTNYYGSVINLGSSYAYSSQVYSTNPATGSAWTISEVNALEAGMRTYTSNGGARVAQVYAVVDYTADSQPVADASADPTSGVEDLFVEFTGDVIGGDAPLEYFWDFKDGTNSTLQNPNHTFSSGTYNVTFTVTDNDLDQDTDNVVIVVSEDTSPIANPSAVPTSGFAPLFVNFTGDFTGGNGPFEFFWDFKDGTNSTVQNPSHTFSAGTYNVSFTVTDDDSDSDTGYVFITVTADSQPVADASAVPTSGTAPLFVAFTGDVTGGNSPFEYFWNFKDGTNSTMQNPNHTFSAGVYNVTFTVTDNDLDQDTDSVVITVNEADSCSDSDGGYNIFVEGNVTGYKYGSPYFYWDDCLGNTTLLEYACSGTQPVNSTFSCVTNTTSYCWLGACY